MFSVYRLLTNYLDILPCMHLCRTAVYRFCAIFIIDCWLQPQLFFMIFPAGQWYSSLEAFFKICGLIFTKFKREGTEQFVLFSQCVPILATADIQDSGAGVWHSTVLPSRPVCTSCTSVSHTLQCLAWCSPGALDQRIYWPFSFAVYGPERGTDYLQLLDYQNCCYPHSSTRPTSSNSSLLVAAVSVV